MVVHPTDPQLRQKSGSVEPPVPPAPELPEPEADPLDDEDEELLDDDDADADETDVVPGAVSPSASMCETVKRSIYQ